MKKNNWITVFTAIFLFILLGFIYETNMVKTIDDALFDFFVSVRSDGLDSFCYFLRDFGSSKMYLSFAVVLLIFSIIRKRIWTGIYLLITLLTARLVVQIVKGIYERPRPAAMYYVEDGFSFPSGHAVMATSFFLTLSFILIILDTNLLKQRKIIQVTALAIILLISFSRIYLHVHHFSDIVAGWLVGYAWYSICKNVFVFLHERKQI
ncbi:phosphatase PAP2 family protein [Bacillus sp. JJ664]